MINYFKSVAGLEGPFDLSAESERTYIQPDGTTYTVKDPVALYRRPGGSTHRVVSRSSNGLVEVHSVPVGPLTVVKWTPKDSLNPVQF